MRAYVYILVSNKDDNRYIGSTVNIEKRIIEHNLGQVTSTRSRKPLKLFAYQECCSVGEARKLEHLYKNSRGRYEKAVRDGKLITCGV